jgi:Big-like domain-containing protein
MRGRTFVVASILCLLFVAAGLAGGSRDSIIEGRTGLLWVGDPQFAVSTGFAADVVMPRAKALRMVAAMNRGALPNFGRRDWRLPTQRELKAWLRSQGLPTRIAPNSGVDAVRSWPVVGAATLPGVSAVAILATNSAQINKSAVVTGDMVVNDASAGPFLDAAAQLKLDRQSHVTGNVKGNSIRLDQQSVVTGNASYNSLSNGGGTISGTLTSPLSLPVFALLPVFHTAAPRAEADDVSVGAGQTVTLSAGDYGHVTVAATGKLVLSGGLYEVLDVTTVGATGCAQPCAKIEMAGATDLRLAGRLTVGAASFVGPQSGSGVDASEIVVYVAGINGTTGVLGATPSAASIGRDTHLQANVYAPNGSVLVERDVAARGALLGRDVRLGQSTTLEVASYFSNHPPVAIPTSALTNGTGTITITLRGSDVDLDDLDFDIVTGPTHGLLGPLVELPPPLPPGDPERPQGDPPRTEATITYTPSGAGDVEDSFVFSVTDPSGASGTAVVTINPPGSEDPADPDPTTVVANDTSDTTTTDRPVTLTLTAGAPAGVSVTFSILPATGPANGSLGTLVQGSESPQRSASVVYTPASGFNGVDSFQFEACGVISSTTVCDGGTATVQVSPPTTEPGELAPDQTVMTPQNTAVTIGLGGLSSSTAPAFAPSSSSGSRRITGKAAFLDPAEVAGNVADDTADGFGDNHNDNLAGGTPVFINAGVGLSGGNGSNGTVRIQIEWDISTLGPIGNGSTAEITLTTNRGTTDAIDTFFFAGGGGNGTLENSDFEANLEQLQGVAMPVTGSLGADGTFSFDVKDALNDAIAAGATFFTVQGRVNETSSSGRGLGVYSSADNSLNVGKVPALILTSPPPTVPPTFTIDALPAHGVLRDSGNVLITAVPYTLPDHRVTYTPNVGFLGGDDFNYSADLGLSHDVGVVHLFINLLDCDTSPDGCDDGR